MAQAQVPLSPCFVVRLVLLDEMSRKPMKFEYMMSMLETILVVAVVVYLLEMIGYIFLEEIFFNIL